MKTKCKLDTCSNYFEVGGNSGVAHKTYCSSKCRLEYKRLQKEDRKCDNVDCSNTFKSLDPKKKYCSHSCAAVVNNARSKTIHGMYSRTNIRHCLICMSVINRMSKNFCSHECHSLFVRNKNILSWKLGNTSSAEKKSGRLALWAKRVLVDFAKYECSWCGWNTPNPVLGRPILAVDHIDGNRYNNSFENLRVLCYNCHTLTETFGTLNGMNKYGIVE